MIFIVIVKKNVLPRKWIEETSDQKPLESITTVLHISSVIAWVALNLSKVIPTLSDTDV